MLLCLSLFSRCQHNNMSNIKNLCTRIVQKCSVTCMILQRIGTEMILKISVREACVFLNRSHKTVYQLVGWLFGV